MLYLRCGKLFFSGKRLKGVFGGFFFPGKKRKARPESQYPHSEVSSVQERSSLLMKKKKRGL